MNIAEIVKFMGLTFVLYVTILLVILVLGYVE